MHMSAQHTAVMHMHTAAFGSFEMLQQLLTIQCPDPWIVLGMQSMPGTAAQQCCKEAVPVQYWADQTAQAAAGDSRWCTTVASTALQLASWHCR
jgi:hypothetical protein